MTVGASIFLVAVGAILRYAVTDSISGVNLATIGLFLLTTSRRDAYVVRDRERYVDRDPLP
jgi:hypothetical protein